MDLAPTIPTIYMAQILRRLGFTTFDQVEVCIKDYDGDQLSRHLMRQRKGSDYTIRAHAARRYGDRLC